MLWLLRILMSGGLTVRRSGAFVSATKGWAVPTLKHLSPSGDANHINLRAAQSAAILEGAASLLPVHGIVLPTRGRNSSIFPQARANDGRLDTVSGSTVG